MGHSENRGLFTCEYIKSGLCKHQIANVIPRFDYTSIVELTLLVYYNNYDNQIRFKTTINKPTNG